MKPRLLLALGALAVAWTAGARPARAELTRDNLTRASLTLDPFRHPGGAARAPNLDPFRRVAADDPAAPAAPAAPPPAPQSCRRDEDCAAESICQANVCQAIQVRTNVLYLYYREGSFREALLLYWARKGTNGYTVLAPFYWHYWSPSTEAQIVAPFYWRFEDRAQRSVMTWYGPVVYARQPGAAAFGLMPIFYASSTGSWAIPFLGTLRLKDPETHSSFGMAAYLYWWWRSPTRSTDLGFPLFVGTRTASHAFTYAVPLNFYWRHEDDASLLALPLFYQNSHKSGSWLVSWLGYAHRDGDEYSRSVAWLYYWGGNDRLKSSYHVFFPLVWDFEEKESGSTVVFPEVWSFREATWNTTVVVPFIHASDGPWYFNTLPPLWWSGGDEKTGRAHRLLIPLFYWARDEQDRAKTLLTPLGGYSRDDREGTRSWAILPLLSFGHRDRGGERLMLTPLYLSHEDRDGDAMTRLCAFLFYRRTDPDGSSTVLFPFFWHFWDAATGATATALFPLFEHRAGPRDTTTVVGPVYWRSFTNGGWGGGLLPIAYFGRNAGRSHAVLFPLFWHFASGETATTVLFPLYYQHADPHGYDAAVTPLLTFGNHAGESYTSLFPLLFRFASERNQTSTTVTPLGFIDRDRDGTSIGFGPIIPLLYARVGHDRSHFALLPIFWHFEDRPAQRSTTVVGPYLHRRWGGETTDAIFPLLHWRRGARPGGADETSFTFFPFVHYRRDAETHLVVTPLGASARGPNRDGGFVGPYIWYDDADLNVRLIPLLHADVRRHSDGQHLTQWGPWFRVSGPGYQTQGIFPLFGHYADAEESDTSIAPSYFRLRRANGDRVDTLPPLFWHSSFAGHETTVIGPYFERTTPTSHTVGVVPLFVHASNTQRTLTAVPPLLLYYQRAADDSREWFSCAIFFHDRDPEGTVSALFPLFWSNVRKDRRSDILFPLFWHFADAATESDAKLLGPFYWSRHRTERTRGILPVAWYARDDAKGNASQALLPLFYEGHGPDHFSFYTLLYGYHRSGPAHFWYAGPILHTDNVLSSFSMIAPLWFSHTNKATETTTTVIPALLHVSRGNPEAGLSSTLAIFWHYRDIASSTWIGLPLFYDVHEYKLSRLTLLVPLFGRYEDESEHHATTIIPPLLFYRHSTPTDVSMVAFPLVWDFKRGHDRTTVVFPFVFHWTRSDHVGTYVFPNYYSREGLAADGQPDGTYRRFVFPFYDSGVKRPGDFMWEVLGGLFGHERIGRHNFLRLFYLTVETSPTTPTQAAWYGQPVAPRRKAVPRGLQVAGW